MRLSRGFLFGLCFQGLLSRDLPYDLVETPHVDSLSRGALAPIRAVISIDIIDTPLHVPSRKLMLIKPNKNCNNKNCSTWRLLLSCDNPVVLNDNMAAEASGDSVAVSIGVLSDSL